MELLRGEVQRTTKDEEIKRRKENNYSRQRNMREKKGTTKAETNKKKISILNPAMNIMSSSSGTSCSVEFFSHISNVLPRVRRSEGRDGAAVPRDGMSVAVGAGGLARSKTAVRHPASLRCSLHQLLMFHSPP
jgi:hypothetical protein